MPIDNLRRWMVASAALLIAAATVAVPVGHAAAPTLLIVGDSLSSGYRLPAGAGWVALLARDLGDGVSVVNDSISGDTTAGGVARLPAALVRNRPDFVIIELGGNDGLRGASLDAMRRNLTRMVRIARDAGAQPVLFGMKLPPNYGASYTAGFEKVYQRVAADTGAPLLPFFLRGIAHDPTMFQADGVHPTARAQPIIKNNVREFLTTLGVGG